MTYRSFTTTTEFTNAINDAFADVAMIQNITATWPSNFTSTLNASLARILKARFGGITIHYADVETITANWVMVLVDNLSDVLTLWNANKTWQTGIPVNSQISTTTPNLISETSSKSGSDINGATDYGYDAGFSRSSQTGNATTSVTNNNLLAFFASPSVKTRLQLICWRFFNLTNTNLFLV